MKKIMTLAGLCFFLLFCKAVFAETISPIPITAEEAFYAVQTQTDPISGEQASVALIDVRTRAEYFWVGAASQVTEILTDKNKVYYPDLGLVTLSRQGRLLKFRVNDRRRRLQVKHVAEIKLSPISINIPYKLWDEATATLSLNADFNDEVERLKTSYDTVIFFCRSGGRSEACLGDFPDVFTAYYEIDQPNGENGLGGFEGTSYGNVYNGYRGFPARLTEIQDQVSVSWKDAGLPIMTSQSPFTVP